MKKPSASPTLDLSVIVTFHCEGIIAHKTMLNIFDLLKPLDEEGITYELILHVDNGDADTLAYLARYRKDAKVRLFENHFGDPAVSRNFCVQKARGRYLALLDGDDVLSPRWLIDGYHMLKDSADEIILHSECDISFGQKAEEPRIWQMTDSRSDDEDAIYMFTRNRWSAGTMLSRATARKFPYKGIRPGFGYEDWLFNMDTRHAGILHRVVPGSVKFYRLRENSTYSLHSADHTVTDYSEMFATPRMQELAKYFQSGDLSAKSPNTFRQRLPRFLRSGANLCYKAVTATPYVGGVIRKGISYNSRRRGHRIFENLPKPVQEAWFYANSIDSEIWPDPKKISHIWNYDSDYNDQTERYCRLVTQIRRDPDYVFLPPRLSIGGTEKVLVNYINALAELHPDWHIVVLAALPAQHPYHLPENVDFVDFYGLINGLTWTEIDFLLSRFIVQTKVKRLHLIHNELAFEWVKEHLAMLRHDHYKVYVSQFMYEFNQDPRLKIGFLDPWIRDAAPAITKIFTDNTVIAKTLEELDGFEPKRVVTHYQPVEALPAITASAKQPMRILWASRVAPQKRPDLLKQIAKQLDPREFQINVYGRCQSPYHDKYFLGTAAKYRGTYNGITSLDLSHYNAFLYTSQTDGLPNILLEIASAGLPIVASSVGGVSDIVTAKTGYPIAMTDIDGYIEALREIARDPAAARQKAEKAQKIVQTRHTWSHFVNQVKRDIS